MSNQSHLGTKFLFALVVAIPFAIAWGAFLMLGWNWWVADTFSLPTLTIGPATGIAFVIHTITSSPTPEGKPMSETLITAFVNLALSFLGLWAIGLVVG